MAAKTTVTTSNILTETVATGLNITRYYLGQTVEPTYNINLPYCDHEFLVNDAGEKVRLLTSNLNSKNIFYSQEKIGAFMLMPITANGIETTLGELLADLMDAEILEDINKPISTAPIP